MWPPWRLCRCISIHVLRVEDDREWMLNGAQNWSISIHVLRVEDDSCSRLPLPEGLISIHVLRVEDDLTPYKRGRPPR